MSQPINFSSNSCFTNVLYSIPENEIDAEEAKTKHLIHFTKVSAVKATDVRFNQSLEIFAETIGVKYKSGKLIVS